MADNGPASTMPMGRNGVISDGAAPNVAGPAMAKPESKGTLARTVAPLTPMSQQGSTPVNVEDNDAFGVNDSGVSGGGSGVVSPLTPSSQTVATPVNVAGK